MSSCFCLYCCSWHCPGERISKQEDHRVWRRKDQLVCTFHISCHVLLHSRSASDPYSHALVKMLCLPSSSPQLSEFWCSMKGWLLSLLSPPFHPWVDRFASEVQPFLLWSCMRHGDSSSSLWSAPVSTRSRQWHHEAPLQQHHPREVIHSLAKAIQFLEWVWVLSQWTVADFHQATVRTYFAIS